MVLRPNLTSRFDENLPPVTPSSKSISSRLRTDLSRRRRASRTTPYSYTSKYVLDQAKRRRKPRTAIGSVRFKVTTISNADVEMRDDTAKRTAKTVILPKELPRPEYCEVSREALKAASIDIASPECPPPELVRELLPKWGPDMLRVLSSVTASPPKDSLPDELAILVNDMTCEPPTHLMAVYGPKSVPGKPTSVKLYPAHGIVFAANCARLPLLAPPSSSQSPFPQSSVRSSCPQQLMARVQPLCLPSPQTYPQLSNYLYTKQTSIVFSEPFLPKGSQHFDPQAQSPVQYASELARKYTCQALLQYTSFIHGLWQNVCALGIFDDDLWEAMDLVWQILLTALAIGSGSPSTMIAST